MDREQRERLVEGALARALAPKDVEPRAGFEDRVLANLATQPQKRAWWRWLWVPAVAAVAVIAIAIGMRTVNRPAPQVIDAQQNPRIKTLPAVPQVAAQSTRHAVVVKKRTIAHTRGVQLARATPATTLPKQDVFPTPVPMTEQEHLLLALVRHRPEQAKLIAAEQRAERQRVERYLETGEASAEPKTAEQ